MAPRACSGIRANLPPGPGLSTARFLRCTNVTSVGRMPSADGRRPRAGKTPRCLSRLAMRTRPDSRVASEHYHEQLELKETRHAQMQLFGTLRAAAA